MIAIHPLASRRCKAYLRDCLGYLGIAAATVPLGILAQQIGWGEERSFVLAASAVPPVVATVVAARREAGPAAATPGKHHQGLRIEDSQGGSLSFGHALLRNVVKIGIPWQLGHTVAVGAAFGGFEQGDFLTLAAAAVTYPLLGVMIVSVMFGSGVAIHDRIAGSRVQAVTDIPRRTSSHRWY